MSLTKITQNFVSQKKKKNHTKKSHFCNLYPQSLPFLDTQKKKKNKSVEEMNGQESG